MFKKFLKFLGLLIVAILLAAVLFPYVFKDKIVQKIQDLVNENLNAEVAFEDVDISFLKSFPKMSVTIENLTVDGVDTFSHVRLIEAPEFTVDMNLSPLWDKNALSEIYYIGATNAKLHVVMLNDSLANYDIALPDTSASNYTLKLNKYSFINANVTYEDMSMPLSLQIKGLDTKGRGDFTQDVFDLSTTSNADSLTYVLDNFTYLKNLPASIDAVINIDFANDTYTLKDNKIKIGELDIIGNGLVSLREDGIYTKADLRSGSTAFRSLVSVIPYLPINKDAKVDGVFSAQAKIDGVYNGDKATYPGFDLRLTADKGSIKYLQLPYPITNISGNVNIKSTKPNMSDLFVDISKFALMVNNESVGGNLFINNGLADPVLRGNIKGTMTLENWKQALPLEDVEQLIGKINADLTFDAKMSDVESRKYENIDFKGTASGNGIQYQSKGSPLISINNATLDASPSTMTFNSGGIKMGSSLMDMKGTITNPLAYFSKNINMKGQFDVNAQVLNLDEWMSKETATVEAQPAFVDMSQYKESEIKINGKSDKVIFDGNTMTNTNLTGTMGVTHIDIEKFSTQIGESDIDLSGKMANFIDYINGTAPLIGDLKLKSRYFNANPFMSDDKNTVATATFQVPANVDLTIQTAIDKLLYTNNELTQFKGKMTVKNQSILLEGIESNVIGGKVKFDGLYDTQTGTPKFNTKIDLSNMQFKKAYDNFLSIKALAPIANFIEGIFNTTLVFEGQLKDGMVPDFTTLSASGYIETINSVIKNAQPVEEVAKKLNVSALKDLRLDNTKNWFDIKNGTVELKEKNWSMNGIQSKIKGSHKIQGEMNYQLDLSIPRKMIAETKIGAAAEQGIGYLQKEAAKIGVNVAQSEFIDVRILLGGKLLKPTIKIIPLGTSGQTLKDEVNAKATELVEKAKDSIRREAERQKDKVIDTLRKTAEKEIDKAKEKVISEANNTVDKIKKEAEDKIKAKVDSTLAKSATDTLVNKAKDLIKEKTGTTTDEIKDKLKDWNPLKKKKGGGG